MSLTNYLIEGLLPEQEKKKVVAVYGGGFKPPTSGHFEVVKQALKENPSIDEFIILIGGKERDGISPEESLLIWDIYKQYLPIKVRIELSPKPPIQAIYNYAKEHPEEEVLWIIGAREGNDDDFKDISNRTTSLDKYPNMDLRIVVTQGGVSGTAARNASKISQEKLKPMLPSELSDEEVEQVYNIVADKIQEVLTENASYSQHIDVQEKIAQLTNHMIDKGMNIEPLPTLEFVDGDSENAKDFFGKTAYYDPNKQHIVLYTDGRHPKDIVRSYAHEMIHHIQNLEDRLGDIAGTDTTSDEHLDKLEQEANLKGTMTFRNWTDSLNEDKDYFGLNKIVKEIVDEPKYKIFSDMDGVLTDFDKSFIKYSEGIPPREYEKTYGKEKFWELIDGKGKVGFWVGMPWMEDGKQYWDYIKNYDTELLSSPSRSSTSRLGKRLWVRNNMPGIKLTLAQAAKKQNYAAPNHILIDDRPSNIDQWRSQGGIGILHTSAADTISQLKKLGL